MLEHDLDLLTIIKSIYIMQFCTIPLDTAKVRLQLQKKSVGTDGQGIPKYRGLLGTIATIAREEGIPALWKGIIPGLQRQCVYGGLRIGLYDPVSFKYVVSMSVFCCLCIISDMFYVSVNACWTGKTFPCWQCFCWRHTLVP